MTAGLSRRLRPTEDAEDNIQNGDSPGRNSRTPSSSPPVTARRRGASNSGQIFSFASILMLFVGTMIGYIVMPQFLYSPSTYDTHSVSSVVKGTKPNDFQTVRGSSSQKTNNIAAEETPVQEDPLPKEEEPSPVEEEEEESSPDPPLDSGNTVIEDANPIITIPQHKEPVVVAKPENPKPVVITTEGLKAAQMRYTLDQTLYNTQSIPTATTPQVFTTKVLPDSHRLKIMVTGGSGFVGSHLVDKLMQQGHEVIVVDNFFTGQKKNIEHWLHHPNFNLVVHDVTEPIMMEVDQIYHLACPASPPHYQYNPIKTIKTSTMGTINMLGLAKRIKARMLLTSTSEVYGDPKVHPQPESYWGNVNTIGPRSCYDEGKRVAETMMYSYKEQNNVDIRVARIFNTFGPRMHPNDGRVVSNFIIQALQNKPITIYGDGSQTRSFQYVSDLVDGLHALMNGDYDQPVNLGNPDEYTVGVFAKHIKEMTNSESEISFLNASKDDPTQRKPVIDVAKTEIGWEPVITVEEGLKHAIDYFQRVLDESGEIIPTGQHAAKPKQGSSS